MPSAPRAPNAVFGDARERQSSVRKLVVAVSEADALSHAVR